MPLSQRQRDLRLTVLRSREECLAVADAVLALVPGGDAEVTVFDSDSSLTRYALNAIHQNVAESSLSLRLRLVAQGRVGVAELRGEAARPERLVATAEEARRLAPVQETLPPLPAADGGSDESDGYSDATALSSPEDRADAVATLTRVAAAASLQAFGAFSAGASQVVIANTRGLRRHARRSAASLSIVMRGDDGAGYADRHAVDIGSIDIRGLADEVIETTLRNQRATVAEPGVYQVVLAPYAVAEMIEYLGYMGLGALARQEGRSFMRPGEQLMSTMVTIGDDAHDPAGMPFPFDWEGVSTRPVTCIRGGVCADFVYDTPTALVDGVASTGHALPMPNTSGPSASHLYAAAGDDYIDTLVGGVENGLYVTRFWYVRDVHTLRTVITGMTREGTFRIEKGRLTTPVRDLRFTQSIVDALSSASGISRTRSPQIGEDDAVVLAPAMRLDRFTFTS
jgi:PmbA protein